MCESLLSLLLTNPVPAPPSPGPDIPNPTVAADPIVLGRGDPRGEAWRDDCKVLGCIIDLRDNGLDLDGAVSPGIMGADPGIGALFIADRGGILRDRAGGRRRAITCYAGHFAAPEIPGQHIDHHDWRLELCQRQA